MKSKQYLIALCLCISHFIALADDYPRNFNIDILHYKFEITLSDNTDELIGKATITIKFKTSDTKKIRLDLINKTEQRLAKGMVVDAVLCNNEQVNFTHINDALEINLSAKPKKNEVFYVVVQYRGIPAGGLKIGKTKYGDRSFFNENWPNNTRHWLPTIDHPYDKATSEFIVIAPAKYKIISNGLLQEESNLGKGLKLTHWKQSIPVSTWLFVLGVAEFAVQYVDEFKGKSIQTWVYPQDREIGFIDFAEPTKQVLEFYSGYVGPYAYEKLANIQSPSVSGGMETSSAIFYGENLVTGKPNNIRLRNVVIHEIAHQWFGNAITESTWDDAWLSEGFATYFTLLFQEYAYGHEEYIAGLKNAKTAIYNFAKKDSTFSIIDNRSAETTTVTNTLTYQKGAWILHMLRERIGHENFKKGIQAYYKKYFNANACTNDFITQMEKASNQDLKLFFNQWLYKPDHLKIKAHWDYDAANKQINLQIEQVQSGDFLFDFPIEIEVFNPQKNASEVFKFTINKKTTLIPIPYTEKPSNIQLDPRNVLLATIEVQ
jgi:aminopeptidase N